jgi:hypothetical protein
MGSALTQAHIENHSDLLAGAILCGTLGAIPGIDEDHYPGVIAHPQALATGSDANAPSQFFANLLANSTRRSLPAWLTPPGRTRDREDIRLLRSDPLCGKPFSNEMTYSVIKGFRDPWPAENE